MMAIGGHCYSELGDLGSVCLLLSIHFFGGGGNPGSHGKARLVFEWVVLIATSVEADCV